MDQWDQSAFEIAFNAWNFELIEIFVRFYKARQRDLNPSFFKDMANSRPNSGPHDEGYFDILTNLVHQNELDHWQNCHCKDNICKIQEMCELMVSYDEDDCENDENISDTDSSDWETIISESSDDGSESSEKDFGLEAFQKACKEDPLMRNRIYLIVVCALLKKE